MTGDGEHELSTRPTPDKVTDFPEREGMAHVHGLPVRQPGTGPRYSKIGHHMRYLIRREVGELQVRMRWNSNVCSDILPP
jgi:protoheme ferro-lyase